MKVISIFGTRPEAIKMAPIIEALAADARFESKVCVTGQHRQMLDQTLSLFGIRPDFDLDIMQSSQGLNDIVAKTMSGLTRIFEEYEPDYALVQGDTTTAMASALAAFYHHVKVGHVEAGLRTGNLLAPWPEEANRRLVSVLTQLHFAPTKAAKDNLLREGVLESRVFVTGNSVIDALLSTVARIEKSDELQAQCQNALPKQLDPSKRLILVTGHRRESFGAGLERVFSSIGTIAKNNDVQVLYPVHLNPNVQEAAHHTLSGIENVFLTQPLDYLVFVYAMTQAYFIITDSGGIQEEAPALGKPLLITREVTERPEAVLAGTGLLVGTDPHRLIHEAGRLLSDSAVYESMSRRHNAFGDGHAAQHILEALNNA